MSGNDGSPAFPRQGEPGMSVRVWLASVAILGQLANGDLPSHPDQVAMQAVRIADRTLQELDK